VRVPANRRLEQKPKWPIGAHDRISTPCAGQKTTDNNNNISEYNRMGIVMEYYPTILRRMREETAMTKTGKNKKFPWSGTDKTSDLYGTEQIKNFLN
jgi:hypothetical protein